ncbi:MAG TPA: hypothetical protein VGH08_01745 [Chthoniobacterales bacterium]|jgi:hypothetical protein
MNRKRPYKEFKNIRLLPSGYQVSVTRNKTEFSKHFAGHSKSSFDKAMRYRDRLLRQLPNKRKKSIPRRLLTALKLTEPVVGVFRYPERRFYQVSYRDRRGRVRSRTFSWFSRNDEIDAYRAAVQFRKTKTKN